MRIFLGKIISQTVPLLFCLTFLLYALLYFGIGEPLVLSQTKMTEHLDLGQSRVLRTQYGLDQPFLQQYWHWLRKVLQGDLGISYVQGRAVTEMIGERVMATVILIGSAFFLGILLALLWGILGAVYRQHFLVYAVNLLQLFMLSVPSFLCSLVLLQVFSLQLELLPTGGMAPLGESFTFRYCWNYLLLPSGILSLYYACGMVGIIRKELRQTLEKQYIRTAYACGIPKWKVILVYGLRNALLPVITLVTMSLPRFFAGAFMIEYIFAWPGMGRLVIESAFQRDYPVLLAAVLIMGILVIISNILAEKLYQLADPRIRVTDVWQGEEFVDQ